MSLVWTKKKRHGALQQSPKGSLRGKVPGPHILRSSLCGPILVYSAEFVSKAHPDTGAKKKCVPYCIISIFMYITTLNWIGALEWGQMTQRSWCLYGSAWCASCRAWSQKLICHGGSCTHRARTEQTFNVCVFMGTVFLPLPKRATIHKHLGTPAVVVCSGPLHRVKSPETSERCRTVQQDPHDGHDGTYAFWGNFVRILTTTSLPSIFNSTLGFSIFNSPLLASCTLWPLWPP